MSRLLRECPFCGGKAEIKRNGAARGPMLIGCTDCHAELESGDVVGLTLPQNYQWNRRAALASGDEVEQLRISLFNAIGEVEQQRNALKFMNGVADELKARLKEAEACIREAEPYVSKGTASWAAEWHRRHAAAIARSTKA